MRRIYQEAFERLSGEFLHILNDPMCFPIEASDLRTYEQLQRYAAKSWIDFPSEKVSAAAILRWAVDTDMKNAEQAKDGSTAESWLYRARRVAKRAGLSVDEQRVASIITSHRRTECVTKEETRLTAGTSIVLGGRLNFDLSGRPISPSLTPSERFCKDTESYATKDETSRPRMTSWFWHSRL